MAFGPAIAAFVVGAVVCLGTSWVLVTRLERVGDRFGFSEALLGMLAAWRLTCRGSRPPSRLSGTTIER